MLNGCLSSSDSVDNKPEKSAIWDILWLEGLSFWMLPVAKNGAIDFSLLQLLLKVIK
jgi:hypothetical protein